MISLERYIEHNDSNGNKREKDELKDKTKLSHSKNKISIERDESKGIGKPAAQAS